MAKTSEVPTTADSTGASMVVVQGNQTRKLSVATVLTESRAIARQELEPAVDLRAFVGAGNIQPLWTDGAYGVLLGINTSTGQPVGLIIDKIAAMIAASRG